MNVLQNVLIILQVVEKQLFIFSREAAHHPPEGQVLSDIIPSVEILSVPGQPPSLTTRTGWTLFRFLFLGRVKIY